MFIDKIQIENYRSCLKTVFDLNQHFSIIIGPNASGKTNILHALLLIKKLASIDDFRSYRNQMEEKPSGLCKLKVRFNINGKKVVLTSKVNIYTNEENEDEIISSTQLWDLKELTGDKKRTNLSMSFAKEIIRRGRGQFIPSRFLPYFHRHIRRGKERIMPDVKTVEILGKIAQHVSGMKYYSASQFTNPSNCPVSIEIEENEYRSRGRHSRFLFDLYNQYKSVDKTRYNQFLDIVGPSGIKLIKKISFKDITTSSIDYSVKSGAKVQQRKRQKKLIIPKFKIDKDELSPNQLSEGTLKTITLIFYLITETSSILLIEEPEVCVHHGLLSSIIDLIMTYSNDKQIVVSTHSDFVLDKVKPENVYRVSRTAQEGTKINEISNSLSKKELAALKNYLNTEGNLGEYWRHGALE